MWKKFVLCGSTMRGDGERFECPECGVLFYKMKNMLPHGRDREEIMVSAKVVGSLYQMEIIMHHGRMAVIPSDM